MNYIRIAIDIQRLIQTQFIHFLNESKRRDILRKNVSLLNCLIDIFESRSDV